MEKINPTSVKVMDYFARKARKIQSLRGHDDHPPTPALGEDDVAYLRRVISAGESAPPLPSRPLGPTAGEYEDNILQLVLYDSNAAQENIDRAPPTAQKEETAEEKKARKKREKEKGKMTKGELDALEKLVDEVKGQTRTRSRDERSDRHKAADIDGETPKGEEKKAGRFASLLSKHKREDKSPVPPASTTPDPEEIDREADELAKVLEDMNLSSASKGPFSFTKSSVELIQEFNLILQDLMNGVPTAYDDLTTLLDDKDNSMNRTYKKLPPFMQKLIAGVPKKVQGKAMGMVNETQAAVGAKPTEAGSSLMTIAQSFLGVATLKELVTNPAGVKGALVTVMNALKLRFPAFLGAEVLLSLGVFILLFSFWYCHKRGREVRVAGEQEKALLEGRTTVLAIEGPKADHQATKDSPSRRRRSDEESLTDRSHKSRRDRGDRSTLSDESDETRRRRERRRRRGAEEDNDHHSSREHRKGHSKTTSEVGSTVASKSSDHDADRRERRTRRSTASDSSSETDSEEERERARRRRKRRERRRLERELEEEEDDRERSKRRERDSVSSWPRDHGRRSDERERDKHNSRSGGTERREKSGSEREHRRDKEH